MSKEFELDAQTRSDIGKGASRRLRNKGLTPAVIYGGEQEPQSITLEHRKVIKALENEAFYSHILTVHVDGKAQKTLLKDLQRHPYKPVIMHMDFQRVSSKDILTRNVPLHFIGEDVAPGVKAGGIVSHQMKDVEISCAATNLPEYLEIDVSELGMDEILHLSDIKAPKGITLTALALGEEHNLPVVAIHKPRGAIETEEAEEAAGGEEGATEE